MTKLETRIVFFIWSLMFIATAGGLGLLLAYFLGAPRISD